MQLACSVDVGVNFYSGVTCNTSQYIHVCTMHSIKTLQKLHVPLSSKLPLVSTGLFFLLSTLGPQLLHLHYKSPTGSLISL